MNIKKSIPSGHWTVAVSDIDFLKRSIVFAEEQIQQHREEYDRLDRLLSGTRKLELRFRRGFHILKHGGSKPLPLP